MQIFQSHRVIKNKSDFAREIFSPNFAVRIIFDKRIAQSMQRQHPARIFSRLKKVRRIRQNIRLARFLDDNIFFLDNFFFFDNFFFVNRFFFDKRFFLVVGFFLNVGNFGNFINRLRFFNGLRLFLVDNFRRSFDFVLVKKIQAVFFLDVFQNFQLAQNLVCGFSVDFSPSENKIISDFFQHRDVFFRLVENHPYSIFAAYRFKIFVWQRRKNIARRFRRRSRRGRFRSFGRLRKLRKIFFSFARRNAEFAELAPVGEGNFFFILRKKPVQSVHEKFNLLEFNRVENFQPSNVLFRKAEKNNRLEFAVGVNIFLKQHFKFCQDIRPL